jgi:hypothetical protein
VPEDIQLTIDRSKEIRDGYIMITKELSGRIKKAIRDSTAGTQIHIDRGMVSLVPEGQELEQEQKPKKYSGTYTFNEKRYDVYIQ